MYRPVRIRKIFASKACRKSVMIGKPLNQREMTQIIRHLAKLDQPWVILFYIFHSLKTAFYLELSAWKTHNSSLGIFTWSSRIWITCCIMLFTFLNLISHKNYPGLNKNFSALLNALQVIIQKCSSYRHLALIVQLKQLICE